MTAATKLEGKTLNGGFEDFTDELFNSYINQGLAFENSGNICKAKEIYFEGLHKAEQAQNMVAVNRLSATILGLIDN